jgi:hypothetical protein
VARIPAWDQRHHDHPCSQVCIDTPHEPLLIPNPTSFDLPDDVFQPGETRPTRPKKKVIKKTEATAQKRGIESLDVSARKKARVDHGL